MTESGSTVFRWSRICILCCLISPNTTAVRFSRPASLAELDGTENRNLDKNMMLRLSACRWITEGKEILDQVRPDWGKAVWDVLRGLGLPACSTGSLTGSLKEGTRDDSSLKLLNILEDRHGLIGDSCRCHHGQDRIWILWNSG